MIHTVSLKTEIHLNTALKLELISGTVHGTYNEDQRVGIQLKDTLVIQLE